MKRISFIVLLFLSLTGYSRPASEIIFEYVDPLIKVFPESSFFRPSPAHADVARGEHASFQFVIRGNSGIEELRVQVSAPTNKGSELSDIKTGFVDFVRVGRTNPEPSRDILSSASGYFPDPIIFEESRDVPFGTTQPIWITIAIPEGAATGNYEGQVKVSGLANGESFEKVMPFTVEVFKPIIEQSSLWVTNWFFLDRLHYLTESDQVEKYSQEYWDLTRVMAKTLADYRQNVAMISPLDHVEFSFQDGKWAFDFSNFNRMVKLFQEEGVIGRIEGGHFGSRIDGAWDGDFGLKVPEQSEDSFTLELQGLDQQGTKAFYSQFLPALWENITKMGWKEHYVQHIADEPIDSNADSYIEIAKFIKGILPEIIIIEACHTSRLAGVIDIWVPQMNFLNEDMNFYKERQEQGEEAWFYTCLSPKGEYANRFIEQPLIKTRLLHWVNHKYEIPGYLHWGFNFWGSGEGIVTAENPFEDTSGMIVSSGNVLPGGDCWISYPGKGEIYPSIRLEAMRDGIVDYELLQRYAKRFPEEAKELVGTTVYGFEHYDTNVLEFRNKRKIILQALSQ
ncbi:hypothetical protein GCM10007049_16810 [Echinicola pacifica]|uniref:Glycoside hydrolase 123 C-terminal domain-containing protein n=1 Tax=Echinicola pacifica TaxID=346377 RepID=A0A918PX40_9BACT|nr:DUF4091 domain-containing protein [Echinicola pacifica]GGZ24993.1 hypothetical protein GCM10007049_16810 [Echinicola pacifica]